MMLLKELSEAFGVSGEEHAVRRLVVAAIREHVDDLHIDALGTVIAIKKGTHSDERPRVMIDTHMDEIGFMVTGIDNNGLLRFDSVGGVDDRILPGLRVRIGQEQVPGVIIWKPIHMGYDRKVTKLKDLRIDIGSDDKKAGGKVHIGDRIVFDSHYAELSETMVRGKAFDNRVGCALVIDILQGGPYPCDVLAAFTVQEEIGLRGAKVAAQRFMPDVAIAFEGTTAHDVPDPVAELDEDVPPNPGCKVGAGPVLTVMDSSMIAHPALLAFMRQTAEANAIPYQFKTIRGGGTDAGAIHISGRGVPSTVISMPCRYIHSPAALLSKADYQHALKLAQAALQTITHASYHQD